MERSDRAKDLKRRAPMRRGGGGVDVDEIRNLVRVMDDLGLVELEVERAGAKVRLVRGSPQAAGAGDRFATTRVVQAAEGPHPAAVAPPAGDAKLDGARPIVSPMIGTFYRAPNPESPPFVEAGSVVEKGDTLCIIEAMKMMNEIEAEFRGRVARVVADNGQTVEYGEPLFLIEPL